MKKRIAILCLLAFVIVLTGCTKTATTDETGPRKVSIAMGYIPSVQFAPVYVAIDRGYFTDEGLDVTLDYSTETDVLQQVAISAQQFGIASGDQIILARASGMQIRVVANWYRRFPVCVVSLADSGINTPQDLVGKTVGIPALSGASYIGWLAFLDSVGLSSNDVNLQVIGYTQIASLTEHRVDAAVCFAMNEVVQMQQEGIGINVFNLDEYTNLVSNGLVTTDTLIEDDPDLVQSVTRAFLHGLQDTIDDPDAAFDIAAKYVSGMDDDTAKLQRAVLAECVEYWKADDLGMSDKAAWQESIDLLKKLEMLPVEMQPEWLYINDFVTNS